MSSTTPERRSTRRTRSPISSSTPEATPQLLQREKPASAGFSRVARSTGRYARPHDRAEDPEDREEDPEEEHPAVTVPQGHQPEREHKGEVQDRAADSPEHVKPPMALVRARKVAAPRERVISRSG